MLPKNGFVRLSIKKEITRLGRPIRRLRALGVIWVLPVCFVRPVCPSHMVAFLKNKYGKFSVIKISKQDCNPA